MDISRKEMREEVEDYHITKPSDASIVIMCSHTALPAAEMAKYGGFKTIGITTNNRDITYAKYYRHLFDELIYVPYFQKKEGDKKLYMPLEEILKKTEGKNAIILPNRSLFTYAGKKAIEEELEIPMYGGRHILGAEERNAKNNQYDILKKAGIRSPKRYDSPDNIDRLVIVKVQQKADPNERAFFCPNSPEDYYKTAKEMIYRDIIAQDDLDKAVIEEFVVGPATNANFQVYGLHDIFPEQFPTKLDLLGFGIRRQTNRSGLMEMPAVEQLKLLDDTGNYKLKILNEETSHAEVTMRESLLDDFFRNAESFVEAVNYFYPGEMTGMCGAQGAMIIDQATNKDVHIVYDTAMRGPGDQAIRDTYVRYLNGKYASILNGKVLSHPFHPMMLELVTAANEEVLSEIVT